MRGGRRPAEWAVFYSKPPSPIRNRDLHNSRRPFTIVSRVLHFAESRPGGARRPAAPGDPAGAHGVLQIPDRWLPAPGRPRGGSTDAPQPGRQDPAQAPHRRIQGGRSITVEGTETQLPAIGVDVTRYWLRNVLPRISSTPGPGSCRTTGTSRSTASPTSVGPTTITLDPVSRRKRTPEDQPLKDRAWRCERVRARSRLGAGRRRAAPTQGHHESEQTVAVLEGA